MPSVEIRDSALDALDAADAAVLVTEWPEFAEIDWADAAARMANPLIVDGRNFLDAEKLREAGFTYEGIGRPSVAVAAAAQAKPSSAELGER
jgi:UDPglucose 6-dehydrogenase